MSGNVVFVKVALCGRLPVGASLPCMNICLVQFCDAFKFVVGSL
jgi:hypothetical protein